MGSVSIQGLATILPSALPSIWPGHSGSSRIYLQEGVLPEVSKRDDSGGQPNIPDARRQLEEVVFCTGLLCQVSFHTCNFPSFVLITLQPLCLSVGQHASYIVTLENCIVKRFAHDGAEVTVHCPTCEAVIVWLGMANAAGDVGSCRRLALYVQGALHKASGQWSLFYDVRQHHQPQAMPI